MKEAEIERYLIKQVRLHGGELRKVRWIGHVGAPDRFVMLPLYSFWVELKSPTGVLSAAQGREIRIMRDYGQLVIVVNSKEDVDAIFEDLGA